MPRSGAESSSRGSFRYPIVLQKDPGSNLWSQQSRLLIAPASWSSLSSATSSVSSSRHTPIPLKSQLFQQNALQPCISTSMSTSPPTSPAPSHQHGHYALSMPQQWTQSYAPWSPPPSYPQWGISADPAESSLSTVPRDFHPARSGPEVRITTPDGKPVILPKKGGRKRLSSVKDQGVQ